MLANVIVAVALVALTVATSVSTTYAAARAMIHRNAQRYADAAFTGALGDARDQIAARIAAGQAMPAFTPSPPQPACGSGAASCAFFVSESIALASSASAGSNLEADANVNEGRIVADVTVSVSTADGTVLARREKRAILRTFLTPPYAVIGGARDGSSDLTAQSAEGDDGGLPPGTATSACAPAATDETVVRAEYYNDVSGACTDASAWRSQPAPGASPSAWTP